MDSRAKQRLTGAIILVALFVLLVPELLNGTKDAATTPASADDEGLRRYTIDLDAPPAAGAQTPAETAVTLPPVAAPMAGPAPGTAEQPAQPGEAAAPPASIPESPAAVQSPPVETPRPKPEVAAVPAPVQAAPKPPAAGAQSRFVVQLGSFSSRDNAEKLTRDMNAKGFATFIAPITTNGRELYRVRVGPTRDRAAAEALASQLKRMGQSGSIVPIP